MAEKTKDSIFKKGGKYLLKRIILVLVAVAVLAAAYFIIRAKLDAAMPDIEIPWSPSSQGDIDLTPDEVMGYNAIDFQQAVLGETTEKKELVVLEREAKADTTITNALANIEIFRKSRTIHTYGTGVYTVDLSGLKADSITMDETAKTITVAIPGAALRYVTIDPEKTEVEDIDRSTFLAFGDIKLTQEQQAVVDVEVSNVLTAELSRRETLLLADEAAVKAVTEILSPVVKTVAEEFTVIVTAPQRPAKTDSGASAPQALDSAA